MAPTRQQPRQRLTQRPEEQEARELMREARDDALRRLTAKRTLVDAMRSEDLRVLLRAADEAQKAGVESSVLATANAKIKMLSELKDFAYVKCARSLREEYIVARRDLPDFDLKNIQTKSGRSWQDLVEEAHAAPQAVEAGVHDASTEEGEDSDEDDDSDLDDLERAERKIERLEKKLARAKVQMEYMSESFEEIKKERDHLFAKCHELEAKLQEALDRIGFLEEGEKRWREKLLQSKRHCKEQELYINQIMMNRSDSEASLVVLLKKGDETAKMVGRGRQKLLKAKLRRDASLDVMEGYWGKKNLKEVFRLVWRAWMTLLLQRPAPQRDIPHSDCSLTLQLEIEKLQAELLRQHTVRIAVGTSKLQRTLYSPHGRELLRVLLQVWRIAHPGICFERQVETLTTELKTMHDQHQQALIRISELEQIAAQLSSDLVKAEQRRKEELHMTNGDFEASICRSREREECLVRSHKEQMHEAGVQFGLAMSEAQETHEAEMKKAQTTHAAEVEAWRTNLQEARKRHAEVERRLQTDIEELEQQVDALHEALKPGGASGKARPVRVVPRSRGVLCAGCLKQILHREVRQLKPSEALQGRTEQLAQEKSDFFAGAIGAPDEHDPAHSWLYHRHKDPHGLEHELRAIASAPILDAAIASHDNPRSEVSELHVESSGLTSADCPAPNTTDSRRPRSAAATRVAPLIQKGKDSEMPRPRSAATSLGAARRSRSGARSRSEALRQEVAGSRAVWQVRWA